MKPEISIILAIYNQDKYLKKCLESLAKQEKVNIEVIVIDDGSYRKIQNSIRQPSGKIKNLKIFRIAHSGTAKARNFGANKAKGEILVFLDGDMRFEKDFLAKLTVPIRKGKAKGTFSTEELVANWDNLWARCWNWENGLPDKRRIDPKRVDMVKDFRAILKSEFDKVNGFDDIGYTDTWSLSKKLGYQPKPVKDARYYHFNPSGLLEVFRQAAWIGGRHRKFGLLGKAVALIRAFLPISLIVGILKGLIKVEPRFILFKLVYDIGIIAGISASLTSQKR